MDILGLTTEEFEVLTPQEQQQTTALVDDVLTSDNVDGSSLNALAALVRLIAYSRHKDLPESLSITFDPVGKFCEFWPTVACFSHLNGVIELYEVPTNKLIQQFSTLSLLYYSPHLIDACRSQRRLYLTVKCRTFVIERTDPTDVDVYELDLSKGAVSSTFLRLPRQINPPLRTTIPSEPVKINRIAAVRGSEMITMVVAVFPTFYRLWMVAGPIDKHDPLAIENEWRLTMC